MPRQEVPLAGLATPGTRAAGRCVTVRVPAALRSLADNRARVQVEVATGRPHQPRVGEVLAALRALYPGVHHAVLDERGAVRPHVNIYVGAENIRFAAGLATPVADHADVCILPAVSGG